MVLVTQLFKGDFKFFLDKEFLFDLVGQFNNLTLVDFYFSQKISPCFLIFQRQAHLYSFTLCHYYFPRLPDLLKPLSELLLSKVLLLSFQMPDHFVQLLPNLFDLSLQICLSQLNIAFYLSLRIICQLSLGFCFNQLPL